MVTVAVIGLGPRGFYTYAKYQDLHPDRMKVVAIADIDEKKVRVAAEDLNVPPEGCYNSAEELLEKEKLADVLIVATQDGQHIGHALAGLRRGYDILLEKPIATTFGDCLAIRDEALRLGRTVVVCHVLRYTTFYRTIKKLIDEGKIGEIVNIDAVENVGYWHQAHSFVRGNWSNFERSSPMILQKSCHDLDILNFLIGARCEKISSFGSLKYFNAAHRPADATDYCLDCPRQDTCIYSAKLIYLAEDTPQARPWLCSVVAPEGTQEDVRNALRRGPYGRCVFACDNDVVDHQAVAMEYEGGITATFTMSGFSSGMYRSIRVMGTLGEIEGEQRTNIIRYTPFGKEPQYFDINKLATDLSGHGGGDNQMMTDFLERYRSADKTISSSISNSIESHAMAFAAEHSRLHHGESVDIKKFEDSFRSSLK